MNGASRGNARKEPTAQEMEPMQQLRDRDFERSNAHKRDSGNRTVLRRFRSTTFVGLTVLLLVSPMSAVASDDPAFDEAQQRHLERPDDPPAPAELLMLQTTEPASQVQAGPFVSVQVNVDSFGDNVVGDAANEPSIAISPVDPNRIAIGWRQFDSVLSNFREAGYGFSDDAGATWTFPGVLEESAFRSDPVLGADAEGNFYYSSLTAVPLPNGQYDDFRVSLFKSLDGGMTWLDPVDAFGGDKQWMAIDRTTSSGHGHIYQNWSSFWSCCGVTDFNRSTDGGASFEAPLAIGTRMYWGSLDVGPDGTLYLAGQLFPALVQLGAIATPGTAIDVEVVGHLAYVADGEFGLRVIDVSNPVSPINVGALDTPGSARNVTLVGDLAYVADRISGLRVIDVSNPASPFEVGALNTPGSAFNVAVAGDVAYVADASSGLRAIDVSDPASPFELGALDTPGSARNVTVVANLAYVADGLSGLRVIDVSDPASPFELGALNTPGSARDVAVAGDLAYVADARSGLRLIDVSNPASPFELGALNTPGSAASVTLVGELAYVADGVSGLRLIDVSDARALSAVGAFDTPGYTWDVEVVGDHAYIADAGSLRVLDVSEAYSTHAVVRSRNARNAGETPSFDLAQGVFLAGRTHAFKDPNPGGGLGQAWVATDHSNGPTRGNVYVLGPVDPPGRFEPLDVYFIRSTDHGETWSDPIRVNDDPLDSGAAQWFGTLSVAPNGRIDAIWNDTRNDPWNIVSEVYYAASFDAGETWTGNIAVTPPFDPRLGYPNQMKLGDYYHMVSDDTGASLAYAATFNGEQDVYFLRIPAPALDVGIDIKPGSDPNSINLSTEGVIPVAILGSDIFDVAEIDVATLAFGPGGAAPDHSHGPHFDDVDADGFTDLMAHYRTEEAGIAFGHGAACLYGETLQGTTFNACDAVRTVPDMDADGLLDLDEAALGTSALRPDTDGDGFGDGEEVLVLKTDPLNAHDPRPAQAWRGRPGRRRR